MEIGVVVRRGNAFYVSDEHGRPIVVIPGSDPNSQRVGYTSTTVSIRRAKGNLHP